MKKNVGSQLIACQLVSATDGSDVTSGTTNVAVEIDGVAGTGGTATHIANGKWEYAPIAGDTNGDHLTFQFTNTSAVSVLLNVYTHFPQTADNQTVATVTNAVTLPTIPANWITAAGIHADAGTEISDAVLEGAVAARGAGSLGDVVNSNLNEAVGTVKTVVDAVKVKTDFLPSATAGAAGGVFIAGTNAATTVTTSFTTTFTGNLTGSVGSVTGHTAQTGDTYALANGATGFAAIDTVVDAIKVATDKFVFTVANQVDANVISINDVTITGDGSTTPYGV